MKKFLTIFSLMIVINTTSSAQYFSWANRIPGLDNYHQSCMAVDAAGNVYCTGYFENTADFDPDTGVFNLSSYGASEDIYLAKYDVDGKFRWAVKFGSIAADHGLAVKVDKSGNVLLAGNFAITVDFDPDTSVYNLSSPVGKNLFIAKYDSSGNFIWAKSFGGSPDEDQIAIDVDAANNVYSTGMFFGTCDFDPSTSGVFNITSYGSADIFISKLDSNGNFVWAKSVGDGGGLETANAISIDADCNVIYGGSSHSGSSFDWDPGPGTFYMLYSNYGDAYLSKLDSAGNFIWAKSFRAGGSADYTYGIETNSSGDIYSTGMFYGAIDLDPDASNQYQISSNGMTDIFISKLDSAGNFVWGQTYGSGLHDYGYAIALDNAGNVYSTGEFADSVDFDPDTIATYYINSNGFNSPDMYNLKLDSAGKFQWAIHVGGPSTDHGNSIAVDNQNNVFTAGKFAGTADFNPDTNAVYNLTSTNSALLFLLKLNQCPPQYTTLNPVVCDSFSYNGSTYYSSGTYNHVFQSVNGCDSTVILNLTIGNNDTIIIQDACQSFFYNGQTYNASGTYYHTLANSFGCDSNVTLNLNLTTLDTTIFQSGLLLMANEAQFATTYQWIDCTTGALMPFANGQYFLPVDPGSYGVILSNNGCVDTSECVYVTDAGIEENETQNSIDVFPNPTSGIFNLTFNQPVSDYTIEIYNNLGENIFKDEMKNKNTIDITNQPNGLYFLKVMQDGNVIARFKLSKVK